MSRIGQRQLSVPNIDDLFTNTKDKPDESFENSQKIIEIEVSKIKSFNNHTFNVYEDDESFVELRESIKLYGQMSPAEVRPLENDIKYSYELISGHRRHLACVLEEIPTLECIVFNCDDDLATIRMVDTNIHRDCISHKEKALSYKARFEACKRYIPKRKSTLQEQVKQFKDQGQPVPVHIEQELMKYDGKTTRKIVAEKTGETISNIQRYLRLAELFPSLLDMVDKNNTVPFLAGVELSYLRPKEQEWVYDILDFQEVSISIGQSKKIRSASQGDKLDKQTVKELLKERVKSPKAFKMDYEKIVSFFPENFTQQEMEEYIFDLLEQDKKQN